MPMPKCSFVGKNLSVEELEEQLPMICDQETSFDPQKWGKENPLYGHCGVVTALAHDLLGGKIVEGWLKGSTRRETMEYIFDGKGDPQKEYLLHLWNELPDGQRHDFTRAQFGDRYPDLIGEPVTREYVLSFAPTIQRYRTLAWRLFTQRFPTMSLSSDPLYEQCFRESLLSDCENMRFGSVIVLDGEIVARGTNTRNKLLQCCEPVCFRRNVKVPFWSPLGCDHAEETALWNLLNDENVPKDAHKDCDIYIAGFSTDHRPWMKEEPNHTCMRCSPQMYRAKVRKILVPVEGEWGAMTPEQAVQTAGGYMRLEEHDPY